jgi:ribosomal-protein-alanine N-acetyltransferase
MQTQGYVIRLMREDDAAQVAEIDHEAFPGDWMFHSLSSYRRELRNPLSHYLVASTTKGMPSRSNQQAAAQLPFLKRLFDHDRLQNKENCAHEYAVGFASLWLMAGEAHITSIAVRRVYRGMGIGEGLLIALIDLATRLDAGVVTLEVRVSNEIAQALYKKYGFNVVGRRPKYYSDDGEDAMLMSTDSLTLASFQSFFQNLKRIHSQKYSDISTYAGFIKDWP